MPEKPPSKKQQQEAIKAAADAMGVLAENAKKQGLSMQAFTAKLVEQLKAYQAIGAFDTPTSKKALEEAPSPGWSAYKAISDATAEATKQAAQPHHVYPTTGTYQYSVTPQFSGDHLSYPLPPWAAEYAKFTVPSVTLHQGDSVQITETLTSAGDSHKPLHKAADADTQDTEKLMAFEKLKEKVQQPEKTPAPPVHELHEAVVYDEAKHPRWPPGTVDYEGKNIGGQFMSVGQTFMKDGKRWEIQQIADGHIIGSEASGVVSQAQTRVFDPKSMNFPADQIANAADAGEHPTIPGVEVAHSNKMKSGKGFHTKFNSVVVDSTTGNAGPHDPSIKLPTTSDFSPEDWQRFGRADQLYYVELMNRFGAWPHGSKHLFSMPSHLKGKVDQEIQKVGSSSAVQKVLNALGAQKGDSTGNLLDLAHVFDHVTTGTGIGLDKARKDYEKAREVEGQMNGVLAWDWYNRVRAPDVTVTHRNAWSESDWKGVMSGTQGFMSGAPSTWTTNWKWGEPNVLSYALPIRNIVMTQDMAAYGGLEGEHEMANTNRMRFSPDMVAYWHEGSQKPPPGTPQAWLDGELKKTQPRSGQTVRDMVAHIHGKIELPLPEADADFTVVQKTSGPKQTLPPGAFMKTVEDALQKDPGKVISGYAAVSTLDLQPGDVIATKNSETRYLVIKSPGSPLGLAYVQLLVGGGYDGKVFSFSSPAANRYKIDKHFDIPSETKPAAVAAVYDPGDWKLDDGPKVKVAAMSVGDKLRINAQDWEITDIGQSKVMLKSLTSDDTAHVNPLWKTHKLVQAAYKPTVGEYVVVHPHGLPPYVGKVTVAGEQGTTIVLPSGTPQTFVNQMVSKLPLAQITPQKDDTFSHDGKKMVVTTVLKNGTVKAKPTGGKVQSFAAEDPALRLLVRPDDYSLGESQKVGTMEPGTLFSGSKQAVRPYMVIGGFPAKQVTVLNLDTGEHSTLSATKGYKLLVHKDTAEPQAATMEIPHEQWSVGDNVPAAMLKAGDKFDKGGKSYSVITDAGDSLTIKPWGGLPQVMGKAGIVVYAGSAVPDAPAGSKAQFADLKVGDKFTWPAAAEPDMVFTVMAVTADSIHTDQGSSFYPNNEEVQIVEPGPSGPGPSGTYSTIKDVPLGSQFTPLNSYVAGGWWNKKQGPFTLTKHLPEGATVTDGKGIEYKIGYFSLVGKSGPFQVAEPAAPSDVDPAALPVLTFAPYKWHKGGTGQKHVKIAKLPEGAVFSDKDGKKFKVKQQGAVPVITDGSNLFTANPNEGFVNQLPSDTFFADVSPPVTGPEKQIYDTMAANTSNQSLDELGLDEPGAQIWFNGKSWTLKADGHWGAPDGSVTAMNSGVVPKKYVPSATVGWTKVQGHESAKSLGLQAGDQIVAPNAKKYTLIHVPHESGSTVYALDENGGLHMWGNPIVQQYKKQTSVVNAQDLVPGDAFNLNGFNYVLHDTTGQIVLPSGEQIPWTSGGGMPDVQVTKLPAPAVAGSVAALWKGVPFQFKGKWLKLVDGKIWNAAVGPVVVVQDNDGYVTTLPADTIPDKPATAASALGDLPDASLTAYKWHKGGGGQVYTPIAKLQPGDQFTDKQGTKFVYVKPKVKGGVKGAVVVGPNEQMAFTPERNEQNKHRYVNKLDGSAPIPDASTTSVELKPGDTITSDQEQIGDIFDNTYSNKFVIVGKDSKKGTQFYKIGVGGTGASNGWLPPGLASKHILVSKGLGQVTLNQLEPGDEFVSPGGSYMKVTAKDPNGMVHWEKIVGPGLSSGKFLAGDTTTKVWLVKKGDPAAAALNQPSPNQIAVGQTVAWKDLPIGAVVKVGSGPHGTGLMQKTMVSADVQSPGGGGYETNYGLVTQTITPGSMLGKTHPVGGKYYVGTENNEFEVVDLPDATANPASTVGKKLNTLQIGDKYNTPAKAWFTKKGEPPADQWIITNKSGTTISTKPIGGNKIYHFHPDSMVGETKVPEKPHTGSTLAHDPILAFYNNQNGTAGNWASEPAVGTMRVLKHNGQIAAVSGDTLKWVVADEKLSADDKSLIKGHLPTGWTLTYEPLPKLHNLAGFSPPVPTTVFSTSPQVGEYTQIPDWTEPNDQHLTLADLPSGTYYTVPSAGEYRVNLIVTSGSALLVQTPTGKFSATGSYEPSHILMPPGASLDLVVKAAKGTSDLGEEVPLGSLKPGDLFGVHALNDPEWEDKHTVWKVTGTDGDFVTHSSVLYQGKKSDFPEAVGKTPKDFQVFYHGHEGQAEAPAKKLLGLKEAKETIDNAQSYNQPIIVTGKHTRVAVTRANDHFVFDADGQTYKVPDTKKISAVKVLRSLANTPTHNAATPYKIESPVTGSAHPTVIEAFKAGHATGAWAPTTDWHTEVIGDQTFLMRGDLVLAVNGPDGVTVSPVQWKDAAGGSIQKAMDQVMSQVVGFKVAKDQVTLEAIYTSSHSKPHVAASNPPKIQKPPPALKGKATKWMNSMNVSPTEQKFIHDIAPKMSLHTWGGKYAQAMKKIVGTHHPAYSKAISMKIAIGPDPVTDEQEGAKLSKALEDSLKAAKAGEPPDYVKAAAEAGMKNLAIYLPKVHAQVHAGAIEHHKAGLGWPEAYHQAILDAGWHPGEMDDTPGGQAPYGVAVDVEAAIAAHGGGPQGGGDKAIMFFNQLANGDKALYTHPGSGSKFPVIVTDNQIPGDGVHVTAPGGATYLAHVGDLVPLEGKVPWHDLKPGDWFQTPVGNVYEKTSTTDAKEPGAEFGVYATEKFAGVPLQKISAPSGGVGWDKLAVGDYFTHKGSTFMKSSPFDAKVIEAKADSLLMPGKFMSDDEFANQKLTPITFGASSSAKTVDGENIWVGDTVYSVTNPGVKYTVTDFAGDEVTIKGPNQTSWTVKDKILTKSPTTHFAFGGKPLHIGDHVVAPETKGNVVAVGALNPDGTVDVVDDNGDPVALNVATHGVQHTTSPLTMPESTKPADHPKMKLPVVPLPPDEATIENPIPDYSDEKLKATVAAGGSTGAMFATDDGANKWLVKKYGGNQDRVATELLANRIYHVLGIKVPDAGVYQPVPDESPALAYPLMPGETKGSGLWTATMRKNFAKGYVADALLGNYDHIGLVQDNVLWNGNEPTRLDQGGTFFYRAQGKKKPFDPYPKELESMMTIGQAGENGLDDFLDPEDIRKQAADVASKLSPEKINELVDHAPFADQTMKEQIRNNLMSRVEHLYNMGDGQEPLPPGLVSALGTVPE